MQFADSEVLIAVLLKIQVLWDVTHEVSGQVVPNVSKNNSAFLFRIYQPFFLYSLSPTMKAV
jgi:hypothetical protein